MKFSKTLTLMAVLLMLFTLAFGVEARSFGHNRGIGPDLGGLKTILELKLSDSQQMKMLKIISKYQAERESLKGNVIGARKNLLTVLRARQFNEGNARKVFQAACAIREELFVLRAKTMTELKAMLTPEQLKFLKERRAQKIETIKHRLDTWFENPSE